MGGVGNGRPQGSGPRFVGGVHTALGMLPFLEAAMGLEYREGRTCGLAVVSHSAFFHSVLQVNKVPS